jgi:hypothetical protein
MAQIPWRAYRDAAQADRLLPVGDRAGPQGRRGDEPRQAGGLRRAGREVGVKRGFLLGAACALALNFAIGDYMARRLLSERL